MGVLSWILFISLSRSGAIGQDEVDFNICTIFIAVFKANECRKSTRLEPLLKDRGLIEKFKPVNAVWVYANNLRFSEKWDLQKWEPDRLSTRSNLFV